MGNPGAREELLAAARSLGPAVREAAVEIERERGLPPELLKEMTEAGLFGMAIPADRGGPELDPVSQIDVIEEVASHDGSVGWCLMIGCDNGYWSSWLADNVVAELWKDDPAGPTAIVLAPGGMGAAVDGGYRLTGRWPFGSGRLHSAVTGAGFLVSEPDGSLRIGPDGMPVWRLAMLPTDETETVDTWHTTGLAGTGSHDFTLADVFVPEDRTFDLRAEPPRDEALYRFTTFFLSKMGAVPLGIARRALDEFATLAATKVQMPAMTMLRDDPFVQVEYARCVALVGSARAWLREVTGEVFDVVSRGEQPSLELRGRYRMAIMHAFTASKEAVGVVYELAGSSAVYKPSIFDRCLRDVVTAGQHLVVQRKGTAQFGRAMLGLDPETPFV